MRGRGMYLILLGAPGVGKTVLAKKILKIVGNEIIGKKDYHEAVANGEWTRRNVIGGLNKHDITNLIVDKLNKEFPSINLE